MTIDIFIPTGEVREAKKNEWWQGGSGDWHIWDVTDNIKTGGVYPIGIRHQVEVPLGVDYLIPTWGCESITKDSIRIPRPKKKVKKWQWRHIQGLIYWKTEQTYSEKQMKDYFGHIEHFEKDMSTEIEVSDE